MSSQCSVRLLDIKETRKARGEVYIRGGAYNWMYFFCLQVDGPIAGGGAYKRQFTVTNESRARDLPYTDRML